MKHITYITNAQSLLDTILRELPADSPVDFSNRPAQVNILIIQEEDEHKKEENDQQKTMNSTDWSFLQKLKECLDKHLDHTDFDQELLSREMGMSRTSLFRKIKKLTQLNPSAFIRSHRLEKAYGMIKQEELSISEIAFATGFNDLAYFSKCFKETYGMTPSAKRLASISG